MRVQDLSHEVSDKNESTRLIHAGTPDFLFKLSSIAAMNSAGVSAMRTRFISPYGLTTSRIEVETTGLPAAKYSGVFVGLINLVASLRANGIRATSHPARYEGKSS